MRKLQTEVLASGMLLLFLFTSAQGTFVPWDALSADNWISGASGPAKIYTVNGSTYDLAFDTLKDGAARGMNAVKFSDGVNNTEHLSSTDLTGSFDIDNTGGQDWTHVLLLIAIDSDTLGSDFSLSLSASGEFSYNFTPATDFCFYNNSQYDTGRPTGFYSATDPNEEGIAYNFDSGMVTVFELPDIAIASHDSFTVNYAFENLPGRAVFSAYADQGTAFQITHTNRSSIDFGAPAKAISTFEVIPEPATMLLMIGGTLMLRGKKRIV